MSYLEKAKAMNETMAKQGGVMQAFEQYYAEDCEICERPTGEIRKGKEAQRKAIMDWFNAVDEYHGAGVGFITSNEEAKVTMVQSWTDCTFKGGGRMKMEEVAVQQWNDDGQIIREDFYYQMGPPPEMG